jgi:hypothetical protein
MSKKLTLGGKEDVRVYVELIAAAAEQTIASIRESTLAPLALLEAFKFEGFGTDPFNIDRDLNLTEQINQAFTYLASFKVAEYVFNSHPGIGSIHLNLGTTAGYDLEADGGEVVGEVFAATRPSSNNKLNKDIARLQPVEAQFKYAFFICPGVPLGEYNAGKYGDVIAWSLEEGT